MRKIKVLLWDIDGTILNFEEAEKAAIRKGFQVFGLGECTDEMLKTYSGINKEYWKRLERGELTKKEILVGRFFDFFKKYGLDTSVAPAFNEAYQVNLGDTICFYPNALETIQALKGKVLQCAVTNGTKVAQDRKLKNSGLDKLLDEIFISEEVGVEKPGIGFFEKVFEKIGNYDKSEIMIIGDSLTSDIQGGNNAGIVTCWFHPEKADKPSNLRIDHEIDDIGKVMDLLKVMKNEEFYLENDGCKIHCKLDYPENMQSPEQKCPLFILEHGFTGHMEERHIVGIAEHVRSLGMAVLRVELYGHGKSDGEFKNHTILKWIDQMLAVIDHAASLSFVTDLYLAGHSQGGLTTILVGAMERDRLKAIIPLAPATAILDGANAGQMLGMEFDPEHIPDEVKMSEERSLRGNYFRAAQFLPVEAAIRKFDKPVLIVHGDADEAVPVKYAYDAAAMYKNCTLKIIKGDTHCYDHHLEEVYAAIEDFLQKLS